MQYITLEELTGLKVKKILSGSELLYLYELYKYCKQILNMVLTIEDAQVIKEVIQGEHFAYVYRNCDINLNYYPKEGESLADYSETERKYFNGDLSGIVFEKQTNEEWVYSYHTDRSANIVLNGYNRSAGYVSLYAYMVVLSYKEGRKVPKLRLKNLSHKQEEMEYLDILILRDYGNKFLKGKVEIEFSRDFVVQPEWEAYIMYNRQLGYMLKESSLAEKRKYMLKEFEVGDVVLYYQTDKTIKSKTIRKLVSCYPGVIRSIGDESFKITYYPLIENYLTRKIKLEEAQEKANIPGFKYTHEDFEMFPESEVILDYIDTGIDKLFYTEDSFIMKLRDGNDKFNIYLEDKEGQIQEVEVGTIDLVYTVFEDRGVKYNKTKFLKQYFPRGKEPIYTKITGKK